MKHFKHFKTRCLLPSIKESDERLSLWTHTDLFRSMNSHHLSQIPLSLLSHSSTYTKQGCQYLWFSHSMYNIWIFAAAVQRHFPLCSVQIKFDTKFNVKGHRSSMAGILLSPNLWIRKSVRFCIHGLTDTQGWFILRCRMYAIRTDIAWCTPPQKCFFMSWWCRLQQLVSLVASHFLPRISACSSSSAKICWKSTITILC